MQAEERLTDAIRCASAKLVGPPRLSGDNDGQRTD